MPTAETKISQFNEYKKSDNAPFFDYADPECLIQRNDRCKNNLENSFTRKVGEHILLGFLMSTILSLKNHRKKTWSIQK